MAWRQECTLLDTYGKNDTGVPSIAGFECLIENLLKAVTAGCGLIFFFLFITGGFKYIFSGGDPKKIAAANLSLTYSFYAILGVIVSYLLLKLIQTFTGVKIDTINLGF